jgi:hypothetical protein
VSAPTRPEGEQRRQVGAGHNSLLEGVSWDRLFGSGNESSPAVDAQVLWIVFWLGGTIGGAVLQARLIDIGVVSDIDPPWIITMGSSFIGFVAGAYAAVKLGDLTLRKK